MPLAAVLGGVGYMSYKTFCPIALKKRNWINPNIGKENKKHVDVIDVESIGEKAALCRCWRSKKVDSIIYVIPLKFFAIPVPVL